MSVTLVNGLPKDPGPCPDTAGIEVQRVWLQERLSWECYKRFFSIKVNAPNLESISEEDKKKRVLSGISFTADIPGLVHLVCDICDSSVDVTTNISGTAICESCFNRLQDPDTQESYSSR